MGQIEVGMDAHHIHHVLALSSGAARSLVKY